MKKYKSNRLHSHRLYIFLMKKDIDSTPVIQDKDGNEGGGSDKGEMKIYVERKGDKPILFYHCDLVRSRLLLYVYKYHVEMYILVF